MDGRRLVAIPVTSGLLVEMLAKGYSIQFVENIDGVPADAECVKIYSDPTLDCTVFVFSHESFDLVPLGTEIPFKRVTFRKYYYADVDVLLKQRIEEEKAAVTV